MYIRNFFRIIVIILILISGPMDATAAWRTGTAMSSGRQEFTMITLGNGKTLAAGGWNGSAYSATAELYDPATGLWTATGSMNGIRGGESEAVLLQDGRVLLVGGSGTGGGVNVEIYDPVAGTWSVTGSLNVTRRQFSLNVLNDGRVLAAGNSACASSSEIYNPATGTWTLTGSMTNGRRYNVGSILTNGNVITVNGRIFDCTAGVTISKTTELYNVAAGTWSSTGQTVIERQKHRIVTLLNGTPMVVGGGQNNLDTTPIAELYDVNTGTWTATGSMTAKKADFEMKVLPSGKVIMAGGTSTGSSTGQTNTSEIYDNVAGTWSSAGTFTTARYFHRSAILADGSFMIGGGNSGSTTLSSVNIYSIPPVSTAQSASSVTATTATLNGTITHTGGQTPTVRGFHYGTTTGYGDTTTENGSFSTGAYTANITGLTCGTTYHYRTYATNTEGTDYSADATFTTGSCDSIAPTISEVTPVTTPTTDSTPNYTFTTDEAGTISYGGSCSSATTSATLGSNTITFSSLADGTYSNCTITVTDAASNASSALSVTSFRVDTTNPSVSSLSPLDNATGVSGPSNLVITFAENVTVQTGNITIKKTSDDSTVEAIDVTSGLVTGTGTTAITVNPATTLSSNTSYYVLIDATAFDDTAGNSYAGISSTTAWNFTIADTTAPTISEVTPVTTPTTDSTPNYTFTTDEAGTISYGGSCTSGTTSATLGSNTITFSSLADGTYSNCTITVTDSLSNSSSSLSVSAFRVDTSAPVLSSISASVTTTTATITWTTDEDSSSSVSYGLTTAYGTDTTETDTSPRVTSHSVAITGLTCATEYNYTVISKDALSYTSSDTNHTFTTSSCYVPVVASTSTSSTSASARFQNLINMGKIQEASQVANDFPNLVRVQNNTPILVKNLKKGNTNFINDVKTIQKILGITIDGKFGPKTEKAVKDFQKSKNLKPDGIVGPITWASLNKI